MQPSKAFGVPESAKLGGVVAKAVNHEFASIAIVQEGVPAQSSVLRKVNKMLRLETGFRLADGPEIRVSG